MINHPLAWDSHHHRLWGEAGGRTVLVPICCLAPALSELMMRRTNGCQCFSYDKEAYGWGHGGYSCTHLDGGARASIKSTPKLWVCLPWSNTGKVSAAISFSYLASLGEGGFCRHGIQKWILALLLLFETWLYHSPNLLGRLKCSPSPPLPLGLFSLGQLCQLWSLRLQLKCQLL